MKKIITIAATLLFLGCNSSTSNKTANATSDSSSSASSTIKPDASAGSAAGTEITVTLTGGPNAGTYTATSVDPTCSEGLTGEKSFGNQYSVKGKADNEFSSLQLIIDDKDAAKKGTDKFSIEIVFGKLLGGKSYEINTRDDNSGKSKDGSGQATLTENGGTKTVVIEGKTAEGVGISTTIICNKIMTANGVQ